MIKAPILAGTIPHIRFVIRTFRCLTYYMHNAARIWWIWPCLATSVCLSYSMCVRIVLPPGGAECDCICLGMYGGGTIGDSTCLREHWWDRLVIDQMVKPWWTGLEKPLSLSLSLVHYCDGCGGECGPVLPQVSYALCWDSATTRWSGVWLCMSWYLYYQVSATFSFIAS